MGVAPFYFHGDNGSTDGSRRTYTLIPPLLFYHSDHELDSSTTTVVGPVIAQSTPKRSVFDIAPFFFSIQGKPESGGVRESHTTLFPLFHYGYDPESSLFILPGYYRRVSRTADTMLTPFFSQAETRNGSTSLTAIGPVVPLWWNYRDRDLGVHAWAIAPLFYTSDSPAGHDWLTPLVGRFETYGESRTWWVFPTLTLSSDRHGWADDFHPIVYVGRSDDSSHTVIAPIFWDFANPKGRSTVGFPLYWRFADTSDDSVVQVAANTLYMQKRVAGGTRLAVSPLAALLVRRAPRRLLLERALRPRRVLARRRALAGARAVGPAQLRRRGAARAGGARSLASRRLAGAAPHAAGPSSPSGTCPNPSADTASGPGVALGPPFAAPLGLGTVSAEQGDHGPHLLWDGPSGPGGHALVAREARSRARTQPACAHSVLLHARSFTWTGRRDR